MNFKTIAINSNPIKTKMLIEFALKEIANNKPKTNGISILKKGILVKAFAI